MLLILGISSPPRSKWHTYTNPGRIRGPWPGSFLRGGRMRKFFFGGGGGVGWGWGGGGGGGVENGLLFERFVGGITEYTKTGSQKRKVEISQDFELQNWYFLWLLYVCLLKFENDNGNVTIKKKKKNRKNWVTNLIIHYVCCWFPRTSSPRFKRPRKGKR